MSKFYKTWNEYGTFLQEFFSSCKEAATEFYDITEYMSCLSDDFVVRAKDNIIGISKKDEQYRFYVSKGRHRYTIKINTEDSPLDFLSTPYDELISRIDRCNAFFSSNRERVLRITKRRSSTGAIIFRMPQTIQKTISKEETYPYKLVYEICRTGSDTLPVNEEFWEQFGVDLETRVDALINSLKNNREKNIIRGRFRDNKTLEAIGNELGLSRERIRQIQVKAIHRLKHKAQNGELLKKSITGIDIMPSISINSAKILSDKVSLFAQSPNAMASEYPEEALSKLFADIYNGVDIEHISNELDMSKEEIAIILEKRAIFDDWLSDELYCNEKYKPVLEEILCPDETENIRNYARWSEEEDRALLLEWNSNMSISEIASYHQRKKTAVIYRYKKLLRANAM